MENTDKTSRSIFVGNIPYEATEEKLMALFNQAGPVIGFRLVYDRESGKPKGYGFCEYNSTAIASSALRNLPNIEYNGRPLRIGPAAGEQNSAEVALTNNSTAMKPPQESPYGERVDPKEAGASISQAVSSLPPEQLYELMVQMKLCIQNNPNEARQLLLQNPQLTYALLQAQITMKIIEPKVAIAMMTRSNEQIPLASIEQSQTAAASQGSQQKMFTPQSYPPNVDQNHHTQMGAQLPQMQPQMSMQQSMPMTNKMQPQMHMQPMSSEMQKSMPQPQMQQSMSLQMQQSMQPPQMQQSMQPNQMQQSMQPNQMRQSMQPNLMQQSMPPQMQQSIPPQMQQSMPPQMQQSMPPQMQQSMPPQMQQSMPPQMQQSMPPQMQPAPQMQHHFNNFSGMINNFNQPQMFPQQSSSNDNQPKDIKLEPTQQSKEAMEMMQYFDSHGEKNKAALILQVLNLTDEQVAKLPDDQRRSIEVLKNQLKKT